MKKLTILVVTSVVLLALVACTTPTATPAPAATKAPTYTPYPTYTPVAMPTQPPAPTGQPTYTPYPTYTPVPTATTAPTPTLGAPKLLKLGFTSAMTGSGAPWGIAFYRGSMMAIDEVNKAGGFVVGGQRYLLDEAAYDDKYLPDEGVKLANRLIFDDKVKFVMCIGGSGPTLAALPIYADNKVLVMGGASFSDQALGTKFPLTFRPATTAAYYYKPVVGNWRKTLPEETKRVAIINANDALGWTVQKQGQVAWTNAGAQIVSDTLYQGGTKDFTPVLTGILKNNPTFIDTASTYPADQIAIVQQVRDLGYQGPIGTISYEVPDDMAKSVKAEYLEGYMFMYFAFHVPDATARQKAYYDQWMKAYGAPFMPASMLTYMGFQPLITAMAQANSLDPEKVAPVLEKLQWDSILGPAKWGGKDVFGIDHELLAPVQVSQFKGGKVLLYYTALPEIYTAK